MPILHLGKDMCMCVNCSVDLNIVNDIWMTCHVSALVARYFVLYKLPGLKFLDSSPVTAAEIAEAKRVGPYTQVIRPKDAQQVKYCVCFTTVRVCKLYNA